MIDIKYIRANVEKVKAACESKNFPADIDRLCALDDRRKAIQQELDDLRRQSNEMGQQMGLYRNPKSKWYQRALEGGMTEDRIKSEAADLQVKLNDIKTQSKALEQKSKDVLAEFDKLMLLVPQPPADDVPIGKDDTENVELRKVREVPEFDFAFKDHVALGKALGIIDIERGVKLGGTRNYVLAGDGCLLHQAVLKLAFELMVERRFTPLTVPVLVRDAMMVGTGYYPGGEEQAYRCERDQMSLVGTAEVPLTAYHSDEILSEEELPRKYVAVSTCFRREAGAAGKDTAGLYRIHLFDKVEQVIICRNDEATSIEHHQEILANAEAVLRALELPYRVVNVCTGDLGQGQVQKFDIETWMPSRKGYGETHSASRFYEFQARRLNLRYREKGVGKKLRFCHTLNNTVIASPRILIALIENHQNADGSITVPKALRPYLNGKERIGPAT